MVARVAAKDAVIAVGIDQLTEILIGLYQSIYIFGHILVMYIVISQSVAQQQGAMQLRGTCNGIHLVIAGGILLACRWRYKTCRR